MPSCLGPNLKEQVIPQLMGGIGKLILGLLLTGYYLSLFATRGFAGISPPDALVLIIVLLIISQICLGIHLLFSRLIASSIASAAVAARLLPVLLFAIFMIISGLLSNFAS